MPRDPFRRRRGYHRPGSGNVSVVEHGAQHAVSRQPVIVHGVTDIRKGESRVVAGRVVQDPVDVFVHQQPGPGAAAGPARPLVDFDTLNRGIEAQLEEARKIMSGFPQIPEVKWKSKLWRFARHPKESNLVGGGYAKGWLIFHPLKLLGQLFTKQEGKVVKKEDGKRVLKQPGIFASRAEARRMAAAAAWRNESGVERRMQEARQRLENSMRTAASELRQKVETGAVRQDNVGEHIAIYNDAVSKAWLRFQGEITDILKRFRGDYKEDDRPVIGALDKGIIPKKAKYIK